jgi:deoxyribodipyrimidine photo-lyase
MTAASASTVIHWFRRVLRLTDNHALHKAIASGHRVQCIFIFDPTILDKLPNPCDVRLTFIHDTLTKLNNQLQRMGGSLLTYYGKPSEVWQQIICELHPSHVYTNRDYEPYAQERDKSIYELFQVHGIGMKERKEDDSCKPSKFPRAQPVCRKRSFKKPFQKKNTSVQFGWLYTLHML